MVEPGKPTTFWQNQLFGLWKWPIPLAGLLLVLPGPTSPIELVLGRVLVIIGGGALLSGVLLRFVTLPRMAADSKEASDRAYEHNRALVAPILIALGALITAAGCALFVLPSDPVVTKAIGVALILLMLAASGAIMFRARHLFMGAARTR